MSRYFTTEIVEDSLSVGVFGSDSVLVKEVARLFTQNNFDAQVVSSFEKITSEKTKKDWYKKIYCFSISQGLAEWRVLEDSLNTATKPTVLVLKMPTLIESSHPLLLKWTSYQQVWVDVQRCISENNHVSLVVLRDVWEDHPWWEVLTNSIKKTGVLVAPLVELFPVQLEAALERVSPVLLAPWGEQKIVFVQGVEKKSRGLLQESVSRYQSLHGVVVKQLEVTVQSVLKFPKKFEVVKVLSQGEILEAVTANQVAKLPKVAQNVQSKVVSSVVVPLPNPVIHVKKNARSRISSQKKESPVDEPIDSKIQALFSKNQEVHQERKTDNLVSQTKKSRKKSKRKKLVFWIGLLFVAAGFGAALFVTVFVVSTLQLQKEIEKSSTTHSGWFKTWYGISNKQASLVPELYSLPGLSSSQQTLELASALKTAEISTTEFSRSIALAFRSLLAVDSADTFLVLNSALKHAEIAYKSLATIESTQTKEKDGKSTLDTLQQTRKRLGQFQQLSPLWETLLGKEGRRTYAILLQDSQELRPTGGFLQAVALITLDAGVITDTQVYSSYELDKKLTGVVEPPAEIKRFLGETRYFLRDANWSPDFPTAATQIRSFLKQSTGREVDGVIAVNLQSFQQLLKVSGPLDIPDYNEVVTDKTVLERAEFHSEIPLVENTTQKEYLVVLLEQYLSQLKTARSEMIPAILGVFADELQKDELFVSLTNPAEQATFAVLGWSGGLVVPDCPAQLQSETCVIDSIFQVEANMGVNKANYLMNQETTHNVTLSDTAAAHRRTTTFSNMAKTTAWPQGTYKTYLRWYLGENSQFQQLYVNGVPLTEVQIVRSFEMGRPVIGTLVEVPIQSKVTVELLYQTEFEEIKKGSTVTYAVFNQHQAGVVASDPEISITLPVGKKAGLIAPQARIVGNQIFFESAQVGHQFVGLQLK